MRTGLSFLQALVGLTTITALVACGDDSGGTGGGGQGGSGSTSADSTVNVGPGPTTGASTGGSPVAQSTGTGSPTCGADVSQDPACNECGTGACCDEVERCYLNEGDCFDADGVLSEDTAGGAALIECLSGNCESECFGTTEGQWCDSTIAFTDPDQELIDLAECLSENCCESLDACIEANGGEQGCIDCLNGAVLDSEGNPDYSGCEAVSDCTAQACDEGLIFVGYCDSGIGSSGSVEISECLSNSCCSEFNACTGGPYTNEELEEAFDDPDSEIALAIQECLDCLNAGGGAACDAAIACEETSCSTAICDSGVVINDLETAACVSDACCAEYNACTGGPYTDEDFDDPEVVDAIQACIDCFNAYDPDGEDPPGALCAAAIACDEASCSGGGQGGGGGGGGGQGGGGGAGGAGGGN
jgi:hypothetical protein